MNVKPTVVSAVCISTRLVLAVLGADVPLGHPAFYPSPERPVGWRGDRSGAFPGATPVTTWNSKTGENIVWKCPMPAPSWGHPIVVGDRVFVNADPNWLICVNARDGKILWQQAVDHTTKMSPDQAKQAVAERAFFDGLFPVYVDACRKLEALRVLAKAKGFDTDFKSAVINMGAVSPESPRIKAYKNEVVDKALADPEIKALFDPLVAICRQYGFTFVDPHRGDNWSAIEGDHRNTKAGLALHERMKTMIEAYSIWAWPMQNWYNCTTMTFATPCSDGSHVYVAFANNQVACYDLAGAQKWLVWDQPPAPQKQGGPLHTRFVPSPLLVGDKLVVNQNGELRVYDKATGHKVWGIAEPYAKDRVKGKNGRPFVPYRGTRPHPEACSPVLVRLMLNGKALDFIADGGGQMYRLSDGMIVCTDTPVNSKGQSSAVEGDLYVWKNGSDSGKYMFGVCRMKALAEDKVECTRLWEIQTKGKGECSPMICKGVVYDGQHAFDAESGTPRPTTAMGYSWNSPILAGTWIVGAGGKRVGPADTAGKATDNVLEDTISTDDPDWDRKPYCGQAKAFGNSSWYAAGNRLFFRTPGYLWCIGDKTQPFNGVSAAQK